MKIIFQLSLFLATTIPSHVAFITPHHTTPQLSKLILSASSDDEARLLLEKVNQIRAELASLEGKTLSQVEDEAKQKKEQLKQQSISSTKKNKENTKRKTLSYGRPSLPEDNPTQILQAATSIERAYTDGLTRQTIRFALVPEGDNMYDQQQWPGGAQQMSREAGVPLTQLLLAELKLNATQMGGPVVKTQDVWDFDGSAIVTAECNVGPLGDVQALVLPNTDVKYVKDIRTIDEAMGDRLFLLVNPFWRDITSWGVNLLAPGAKKLAQEVIFSQGYQDTYAFHRMSVRGEICASLKAYPHKWQLFAYLEDGYRETPVWLGETEHEPGYKDFADLLNEREEFKLSKNMRILQRMRQ